VGRFTLNLNPDQRYDMELCDPKYAGVSAIPERWLKPLELNSAIEAVAEDLWVCSAWKSFNDNRELWARYPGY
tara:strand:- start:3700 stop:3918 length:219 start_codon:yes stop_codon:yes gene_type:complete